MVLDTNVVSELARKQPHTGIANWARQVAAARLCTTTITEAELLLGVALMPAGRRRDAVATAVAWALRTVIGGRVLPFDRAAAQLYPEIAARRRRAGRPVGTLDLQIAAIGSARAVEAIVTRNTDDFAGCGVVLINPWETVP